MKLRFAVLMLVALLGCTLVPARQAAASTLITRNPTQIGLKVDRYNRALVSYWVDGRMHHTLWWGAVNARFPDPAHPSSQAAFNYDYSGGWGSFGAGYWKRMRNVCGPYTGPALPLVVKACTMPAGDHWVLQSWRRLMPNGGWPCCGPKQGKRELRISHFTGPLPELWLKWNYSTHWTPSNPLEGLYGRYSYKGRGLYGFSATPAGAPTDSFGILIWVDTYDSEWGAGWRRINSFLTHRKMDGAFCDQLWPNRYGRSNSPGHGTRYRAFADGTNPLPVVEWQGPPPGAYNVSPLQTRAGLGQYSVIDWLRHPFDATLAGQLAEEQTIVSAGDPDSACRFT
jgi:hypothetical protein